MPEINFSELMTPLNNLDTLLSGILQQMQDSQPQQQDRLQELFDTLPNIEADVKSVLLELQSRAELPDNNVELPSQSAIDYLTPINNIDAKAQAILQEIQAQASRETTISFDTVVTPLNNIAGFVQNILTALSDRQPPNVTVSPNLDIDLGGAY